MWNKSVKQKGLEIHSQIGKCEKNSVVGQICFLFPSFFFVQIFEIRICRTLSYKSLWLTT